MTGVQTLDLGSHVKTVQDGVNELKQMYPILKDILDLKNVEVSLLLGNKALRIPDDLNLAFSDELIIAPIISGG
jgi:hypothetical protein